MRFLQKNISKFIADQPESVVGWALLTSGFLGGLLNVGTKDLLIFKGDFFAFINVSLFIETKRATNIIPTPPIIYSLRLETM